MKINRLVSKAEGMLQKARFDEAKRILEQLHVLAEGRPETLFIAYRILTAEKLYAEAGRIIEPLETPAALLYRGQALLHQGDRAQAEEYFQKCLKKSPENIIAQNCLALCRFLEGGQEDALKRIKKNGMQGNPDFTAMLAFYLNQEICIPQQKKTLKSGEESSFSDRPLQDPEENGSGEASAAEEKNEENGKPSVPGGGSPHNGGEVMQNTLEQTQLNSDSPHDGGEVMQNTLEQLQNNGGGSPQVGGGEDTQVTLEQPQNDGGGDTQDTLEQTQPDGGSPHDGGEDTRERAQSDGEADASTLKLDDLNADRTDIIDSFVAFCYMTAGQRCLSKENFPKAVQLLRRACELAPKMQRVHFLCGEALLYSGQYEEALKYLKRALRNDGEAPEILYHLGRAYQKTGNFSEAENCYEKSLEKFPKAPEIYFALGEIEQFRGNQSKAIDLYLKGALGDSFYMTNLMEDALTALKKKDEEED